MNKLVLNILGPTATGKTPLALALAKQILAEKKSKTIKFKGVELISADSRQVYQDLKITSGADIPTDFTQQPADQAYPYLYFQHQKLNLRLHGVAILTAEQEWSVTHFQQFCQKIIQQAWKNQFLPIIIGGTGLYHRHLFNPDSQLKVKPNLALRQKAAQQTVDDLQTWLQKINPTKLAEMNHSDRHNPRRLIRAIEIAATPLTDLKKTNTFFPDQQINLGLNISLNSLKTKIQQRVVQRFQAGAVEEVKKLLAAQPTTPLSTASQPTTLQPTVPQLTTAQLPIFTTLGVPEISAYLQKKIDQKECLDLWALHEFQYAKRQITWFKKIPKIDWFDAEIDTRQQAIWQHLLLAVC